MAAAGNSSGLLPEEGAAASGLSIVVDVSERTLYLKEGGETVESYPVTVGTSAHPTPRGSFSIRRIVWNPRWVPPDEPWAKNKIPRGPGDPKNPMGKVKLFIVEPDYYIHGTLDTKSLGTAASHGCIRMSNPDVIAVAKKAMAYGGSSRPASWFQRVLNRVRSTEEVRLSSPIPVRIES